MFWTGVVLTPLLLQGFVPAVATFLNTPAWTMSAEAVYYVIFPWLAKWKRPERIAPHLVKMAGVWVLGLVPGALYIAFNPDGIAHPDRWSYGPWLWALKYTPYAHVLQLCLRRDAGRSGPDDGAHRAICGCGSGSSASAASMGS